MKRICVFCGSNSGVNPVYAEAAKRMGAALVRRGIGLVYGGGRIGLMGTIADTVIAEGGEVIGIIPEALATKEVAHQGLTELHIVESMHERKAMMAELSDGFIAMPGGFGTFEEFCEVLTWAQLGIHLKPCGLLNVENYYGPLLTLFNHAVAEGFVRPEYRSIVLESDEPDEMIELLESYRPPHLDKWLNRDET